MKHLQAEEGGGCEPIEQALAASWYRRLFQLLGWVGLDILLPGNM
jgi:hypothetical protein